MSGSIGSSLLGSAVKDDGTCITGAYAVYNASGSLPQLAPSRPAAALGGVTLRLPLTQGRSDTGLVMDATGAAGLFHIVNSTGTSLTLLSEAANNNTKTDYVLWELQIPEFYKAGANLTITVSAKYTAAGTAGTKTILADCYLLASDGTSGTTLVATSAATLTTSTAEYAFTVTGTTLTPGARVLVRVKGVIQETAAGGNNTITVNSVRISA